MLNYLMAAWRLVNLADKPYMRLIVIKPADFALISSVRGTRLDGYVEGHQKSAKIYFFSWCSRLTLVKLKGSSDWADAAFTHL